MRMDHHNWWCGHRRWFGLRQACCSPTAWCLKALRNSCRKLHSAALQRNPSDTRDVVHLPRGMSPYQRSRVAAPTGLQSEASESRSDSGNHLHHGFCSSGTPNDASLLSPRAPLSKHLPPWPVDAFEFNAIVAHGGHDIRLASRTVLSSSSHSGSGVACGDGGSTTPLATAPALPGGAMPSHVFASVSIPKLSFVTLNTIRHLKTVEETTEAQAALRDGGWVCTGCWSIVHADGADHTDKDKHLSYGVALFPRTVCPTCRTLRHDAHTSSYIAGWRLRPELWKCTSCGEANRLSHLGCRCCGAPRSGSTETDGGKEEKGPYVRISVADEVASCPIGHVVVTRNRTTRWRCGVCKEINSLQMAVCRHCTHERFAISVACPTCDALRVLSNALVFGSEEDKRATRCSARDMSPHTLLPSSSGTEEAAHSATKNVPLADPSVFPERVFDPENCYTPNTTQVNCLRCRGPLHGGRVVAVNLAGSWWCACGVVNTAAAYSCLRCRLPRFVGCPDTLRALLLSAGKASSSLPPPPPVHDAGSAVVCAATLPTWDFRCCTNWMCDSCCGVNSASYQVVANGDSLFPSSSTGSARRGRRLWMRHGNAVCRHCGAPWHHHVLHEGDAWRCACHMLNSSTSTLCASCGLPALDGLRSDMLSTWSKGDWRCPSCGSLCYRDRQRCSCGTLRSTARLGR